MPCVKVGSKSDENRNQKQDIFISWMSKEVRNIWRIKSFDLYNKGRNLTCFSTCTIHRKGRLTEDTFGMLCADHNWRGVTSLQFYPTSRRSRSNRWNRCTTIEFVWLLPSYHQTEVLHSVCAGCQLQRLHKLPLHHHPISTEKYEKCN